MLYCALLLSSNLHTVNTSVIYCNLRSGLSTLELNEYCIVFYCTMILVFFQSQKMQLCFFWISSSEFFKQCYFSFICVGGLFSIDCIVTCCGLSTALIKRMMMTYRAYCVVRDVKPYSLTLVLFPQT